MGLRHRCGRSIPSTVDRRGKLDRSGRNVLRVHKKGITSLVIEIWVEFEEEYTPGKNRDWSLVGRVFLACARDLYRKASR